MPIARMLPTLAFCCALVPAPATVQAQDFFELEIFEYDTAPAGGYEVELHTNGISRGSAAPAAGHKPIHLSVELARGWTDRFETGVFIQTAPLGGDQQAPRFAGGHVRPKYRFGDVPHLPFRVALAAEYAFNRPAFDYELQTLELRPILDRRDGRLSLVLNPGIEFVVRGAEGGFNPSFDISGRAAWDLSGRVSIHAEYYSRPGTIRHLLPEETAHHMVFSGLDIAVSPAWEMSLGAGHCVTSDEPWVVKSVVGYRFGR